MGYKTLYQSWLNNSNLGEIGFKELSDIKDNQKEIEYRFGTDLEFGTAGMRGIIGYGTNMINIFTVRRATLGLCRYILSLGKAAAKSGVAIAYDTRQLSREFAQNAAGVLSANGIKVFIYKDVRPVPMLSYAVRKLGATAGIMITASHNPKEYNGFKVYGSDGAQMSPQATSQVVEHINNIDNVFEISHSNYTLTSKDKNVKIISKQIEKAYYKELIKLSLSKEAVKKMGASVRIVYTPVHGSGYVPVTTIMKKLGIKINLVKEQTTYDSEFSTVQVPNPEFKETLTKGIELADKIMADVVLGTDPDCDRLGVAVRAPKGEFVALSGNQIGVLLLDYILTRLKEDNKLPANGFVVKSFVTTGQAQLIADEFGVELIETPVGFKFIGEKIKEYEKSNQKQFVFGFEESCGYLRGTHCRDKDAVVASMLFAEMVCYYALKNISVYSRLESIYDKYGYVLDQNVNIAYSGLNAMKDMNAVIDALKQKRIEKIDIYNVIATRDYSNATRTLLDGTVQHLNMPKSNSIYYELENGSFICLRPSGTEPKLKIYYSIKARDKITAEKFFKKLDKSTKELINK